MKRWRIADAVWNGNEDNDQAIVYGLYPYRIAKAKPGTQDQDKYIFVKTRSERFKVARTFQQSNYYSFIEDAVINNNPTIVKTHSNKNKNYEKNIYFYYYNMLSAYSQQLQL